MDSLLTSDSLNHNIYYYKPANYDFLNSPILWGIHGTGGTGASERNNLRDIADKRKALIVGPTFNFGDGYAMGYSNDILLPYIFKEIYQHVITKENRDSIWVYMIGFSAGGQCVTRYMLFRQSIQDSIPIRMAVSTNPAFYTFCTDSLNGEFMPFPCGLGQPDYWNGNRGDFICNQHIIQYYNENYGILIGTADLGPITGDFPCANEQGFNRYERAQSFYAFSNTDAIIRGTTLRWQYKEIPGIGHNGYAMYNTKADSSDTSTIAETLLFDTPYNPPPNFFPSANFTADNTIVYLPDAMVLFVNNSLNAQYYHWDFGDSTTSTEMTPLHIYTYADTFTVSLIAYNDEDSECGADTLIKEDYIIVINLGGMSDLAGSNEQIYIYPNPNKGIFNIVVKTDKKTDLIIELMNIQGQIVYKNNVKGVLTFIDEIDVSEFAKGIYYLKVNTGKQVKVEKVVVI